MSKFSFSRGLRRPAVPLALAHMLCAERDWSLGMQAEVCYDIVTFSNTDIAFFKEHVVSPGFFNKLRFFSDHLSAVLIPSKLIVHYLSRSP